MRSYNVTPSISNRNHIEDMQIIITSGRKKVVCCDLSCPAVVAAELVVVKQRESCGFTCYFREGTKALRPAFIQDETSESQFSLGRLKILLQRKNHENNFNQCG